MPRDGLDYVPADKDEDILVTDILKTDRTRELIDKPQNVDNNR